MRMVELRRWLYALEAHSPDHACTATASLGSGLIVHWVSKNQYLNRGATSVYLGSSCCATPRVEQCAGSIQHIWVSVHSICIEGYESTGAAVGQICLFRIDA